MALNDNQTPLVRLALYEPDIPQNTGTMLRLAACLGVAVDVIEPCGFVLSDSRMRRAGLDYLDVVDLTRHISWSTYWAARDAQVGRLVLLTTGATTAYTQFAYRPGDTLLLGRESAGVPDAVHQVVDAAVVIPMVAGMRSLNVAVASAMVLGEALRQIEGFAEMSS
jgi:tRNA (cytidine/uridine-2'-O-)-methyltransferase